LKTQNQNCKYCQNFQIAVYAPMNSGYCKRKEFEVVYNSELGQYERKQKDAETGEIKEVAPNKPCAHFKPAMPNSTREWLQNIFKE